MPAKSKAQQRFMGMVHAAQKGEGVASPEVAQAAKSMSKKSATEFDRHNPLAAYTHERR